MMPGVHQSTFQYTPLTSTTEYGTLIAPAGIQRWNDLRTNRPYAILCVHGHGANSLQYGVGAYAFSPGSHARALAEAGFLVLSIDQGGATPFGSDLSMRRMLDAYTYLLSLGCQPHIGIMGWSMGGVTALNFLLRFPDIIAGMWLWVPLIDNYWARSDGGYVPPDGSAVPNNGSWNSEIDAAYAASTKTTAAVNVPAIGAGTVTIPVTPNGTDSFGDSHFASAGNSDSFYYSSTANRVYYASKDRRNFYGCATSVAAGITIPSGATIQTTWGWQKSRYSPMNLIGYFRGLGVPVAYALASDDTTIPPSQADYWLAQLADPNHYKWKNTKVTGGHTGLFQNIPYQDTVQFFSDLVLKAKTWKTRDQMLTSKRVADVPVTYPTVTAMATSGRKLVQV